MRIARIASFSYAAAAFALTLSMACACATPDDNLGLGVDAGSGGAVVLPDGGRGIVIVGADSGFPSITISDDGGQSSLNPMSSGTGTSPGFDSGESVGSADSGSPGTGTGTGGSGMDAGTAMDSGSHHHDASSGSGTGTGGVDAGGGGVVPTTCAKAGKLIGCCGPDNTVYYCNQGSSTVENQPCASGTVCGWGTDEQTGDSYYGCVTGGPSEADPSGEYPLACE